MNREHRTVVSNCYLSPQFSGQHTFAAAMPNSSQVTRERVITIRDLVLADPAALDRWPLLVDDLVKSPDDVKRVKGLFKEGEYGEAVLKSLEVWFSHAGCSSNALGDLISLLRKHNLNALAGEITRSPNPEAIANHGVWFEVGEVVHNFTGRITELEQIHRMLTEGRSRDSIDAGIVGICGPSGIGKTVLARKYAFTQHEYYQGNAIWINGGSPQLIRDSFQRLAQSMGIIIASTDQNFDISSKAYTRLRGAPSLLIVDNLQKWSDFNQFKPRIVNPQLATPSILITYMKSGLIPVSKNQLRLGALTLEEASQLVQHNLPDRSDEDVTKLVEKYGRHPLALSISTYFCTQDTSLRPGRADILLERISIQSQSSFDRLDREVLAAVQAAYRKMGTDNIGKSAIKILTFVETLIREYDGGISEIALGWIYTIFSYNISELCFSLLEKCSLIEMSAMCRRKFKIHDIIRRAIKLSYDGELLLSIDILILETRIVKGNQGQLPIVLISRQQWTAASNLLSSLLHKYRSGDLYEVVASLRANREELLGLKVGKLFDDAEWNENNQRILNCIKAVEEKMSTSRRRQCNPL